MADAPVDLSTDVAMGQWLRRVRGGATLLFWTYLVVPVTISVLSWLTQSLLPRAPQAGQLTYWVMLFFAYGSSIPKAMGAWSLAAAHPDGPWKPGGDVLRHSVRVVTALEVLRLAWYGASWLTGFTGSTYIAPVLVQLAPIGTALIALYSRQLAQRCEAAALARSLRTFVLAYVALKLVQYVALQSITGASLSASAWLAGRRALLCVNSVSTAAIGIWGLVLIWRLRRSVHDTYVRDRCASCGYPTRGLPEPRCPECGRLTQRELERCRELRERQQDLVPWRFTAGRASGGSYAAVAACSAAVEFR